MPSDVVRLGAAALYALIMAADTHMAMSGRYERAKIWTPHFPCCANNRVLSAGLWAAVHILLLLWVLGVFTLGWSDGPEVLMIWAGVMALNRIRRARGATACANTPPSSR